MFKGVIIEESLEDTSVLKGLHVLKTEVVQTTEKSNTPWLRRWTLHEVEIPEERAAEVADTLSSLIDREHAQAWYADFSDEETHYIIFRGRVFAVDCSRQDEYDAVNEYGRSLGIPAHQIKFAVKK
ncbi:MAG: hypothetical protein AAB955_02240 [Patescibacteria group bacterium]